MATRVERQSVTMSDSTEIDIVVGYADTNVITADGSTYTTQESVVDIEIDYSPYYERISTAIEKIAANSTEIKSKLDAIEQHFNTSGPVNNFAEQLKRLRDLADKDKEGSGIRTISPYGELGQAMLWQLYIEKGRLLEFEIPDDEAAALLAADKENPAIREAAMNRLSVLIERYQSYLKGF